MAELSMLAAMTSIIAGGAFWAMAPSASEQTSLAWETDISQGAIAAPQLALDRTYLRRRGVDALALQIRRVTDFDQNGIDEVWLRHGDEELVITFQADGTWRHLGALPPDCTDIRNAGGGGLPMIECSSVTWAVLDSGVYQPLAQDGVVVWGVPSSSWDKPGQPPPELTRSYRATLRRATGFAGFLASQGIDQPVHYLVCEGALPEMEAAVLLENGLLRVLPNGCGHGINLGGLDIWAVSAVAFTAMGHQALLDDIETFLSGSPDALFRPPEYEEIAAAWMLPPAVMGARWLTFDASDHYFEPSAREKEVKGFRRLPRRKGETPQAARTATLVGSGLVKLDADGCAALEVETAEWTCAIGSGCLSTNEFLTVKEVGCGEPTAVVSVPYTGGRFSGEAGGLEVRVDVSSTDVEGAIAVHQARVGWRPVE